MENPATSAATPFVLGIDLGTSWLGCAIIALDPQGRRKA